VNTLVNLNGTIVADNTDIDGFAALIPRSNKAAVLGRGPTARAAMVALENANIPATMFTRDNMHELRAFDGELIINTMPPEADVAIPPCRTYFEAAYSGAPKAVEAERRITGLDLLHAQAVRQHQLFMKVFDGL
jgi:shikimate 5-dehydrogenase